MALNFPQVQIQVKKLGEGAPLRQRHLLALRERARELLNSNADQLEHLRGKVAQAVHSDPNLRCALPVSEQLNQPFHLPALPERATILAADGSQIAPNRHAEVDYCLINVGAIQMCLGSPEPPTTVVNSRLFYDEQLYTATGTMTEASLALQRDLEERTLLAELAQGAQPPVITFTDGPMELWGAKDEDGSSFSQKLAEYQQSLCRLAEMGAATAGYVDKPAANLVVRLLEVALMPQDALKELRHTRPLRGVVDKDLYQSILEPGERSAVYAIQSKSAGQYEGEVALHFFYLNVGREGKPWLARVEIPAWVASNPVLLNSLHAALVAQCHIMGSRPYPYLLHRAHEVAVVTFEEQDQVTQMIALELRRRGVQVGEASQKQAIKDSGSRTRYEG